MIDVMTPDPLIDDVREVRRKISAEFGHDPQRLVRHYMDLEQEMRRTGRFKFRDAPFEKPEQHLILHDKPPGK
jgi:hypothetical protein